MLNNIAAIGQKYTRNIVRVLHIIEDTILVTLLLAMILLAGYDILARTLFGGGVAWISPILKIMVLWVGLLGALLATRTKEHISIDIVGRLAPTFIKHLLSIVTSLISAAVCILIAWHSQEFVKFSKEFGDIAFARVPAWPLQIIIPISFAIMGLRFFLQSISAFVAVMSRTASTETR